MLDGFKNNSHSIAIYSAYMGSIMAMICGYMWCISMVGMMQANHTGANINCLKLMKKWMYNSICWQHTWWLLCFSIWSGNAFVKTISNFHGPLVPEAGMGVLQKKKDNKGKLERTKTAVQCPVQTQTTARHTI